MSNTKINQIVEAAAPVETTEATAPEAPTETTETAAPAETAAPEAPAETTETAATAAAAATAPAASDETTETATPEAPATPAALDVFDVFAETAVPAETTETTAPAKLHISNVIRRGDSAEVIVFRTENKRTVSVHYDGTDTDVTIPYVAGVKRYDRLPDGGLVVSINAPSNRRVYATITISIDELADRFPERFSDLAWEARTKKRKSSGSGEGGEA